MHPGHRTPPSPSLSSHAQTHSLTDSVPAMLQLAGFGLQRQGGQQRTHPTGVMESASSRMSILNGGQGYPGAAGPTAWEAKFFILLRTTLIPLSSLAFSSSTRVLNSSGLVGSTAHDFEWAKQCAQTTKCRPANRIAQIRQA